MEETFGFYFVFFVNNITTTYNSQFHTPLDPPLTLHQIHLHLPHLSSYLHHLHPHLLSHHPTRLEKLLTHPFVMKEEGESLRCHDDHITMQNHTFQDAGRGEIL